MNKRINILLVAGLFIATTVSLSQDNIKWENLFDGKSLNGWEQIQGTAKYEVKDGMIIGTTVLDSPNSFLVTNKHYSDFILELEFKVDEGLNSGIQFRSNVDKNYREGIVHGYQVEIDPVQKEFY